MTTLAAPETTPKAPAKRPPCTYAACGVDADNHVRIEYPEHVTGRPFRWGAMRCLLHTMREQDHANAIGAVIDVEPLR